MSESSAEYTTLLIDNEVEEMEWPLPEWAIRRSEGDYTEVGAVLPTRDGRRFGNAVVLAWVGDVPYPYAVVMTDIGNTIHLSQKEMGRVFYPPEYVTEVIEAETARWRD